MARVTAAILLTLFFMVNAGDSLMVVFAAGDSPSMTVERTKEIMLWAFVTWLALGFWLWFLFNTRDD